MVEDTFKALVVRREGKDLVTAMEDLHRDDLPPGELLVKVAWSSLNYKDAMALGNRGILRTFPAVPGIDFAGTVVASADPAFRSGDGVLVTGWGVGETAWGGFAQLARVKAGQALPLPAGATPRSAMVLGTAGLTAMLCVQALEAGGLDPAAGEILVTGATGGVGSIAVALLGQAGCAVAAMTGKPEAHAFLEALGARRIVTREAYATPAKPGRFVLATETFQAAVDTVGGDTLASILARLNYGGSVAACGLVAGANLDTTVYPFILRGVNLLGIDSVRCPAVRRKSAWERLFRTFPAAAFEPWVREVPLAEVGAEAARMLEGGAQGRVVVRIPD
jgi:acrylyl-CoA reductase (NADPH)